MFVIEIANVKKNYPLEKTTVHALRGIIKNIYLRRDVAKNGPKS